MIKPNKFKLGIQTIFQATNRRMPENEVLEIWYKQVSYMNVDVFFEAVDRVLKDEEALKGANIINLLIRSHSAIRKERAPEPEQQSTGLSHKQQVAWARSIRLQLAQTSFAKRNGLPIPKPLEEPNMALLDDKIYKAEFAKVDYAWHPKQAKKRAEQRESVLDALL